MGGGDALGSRFLRERPAGERPAIADDRATPVNRPPTTSKFDFTTTTVKSAETVLFCD